jgi:hypothetical protein
MFHEKRGLEIGFENLQMSPHSVILPYKSIIQTKDVQKKHTLRIVFRPGLSRTEVYLENFEFFILMRVLEEIMYFVDCITDSKKQFAEEIAKDSEEMQAFYDIKKQHKILKRSMKSESEVKLILKDIEIVMPRGSRSNDYVRFQVEEAEITISRLPLMLGSKERVFTVPTTTKIQKPMKDKLVADMFKDSLKKVMLESTQIVGPIKGITMSLKHGEDDFEIPLAVLRQIDLVIAVPEEKHVDKWEVQAILELKLTDMDLVSNVGNLVKLSFVFEDNADEVSPFIKIEKKWYKQIEMKIGVKEGAFSLQSLKTENKS